MNDKGRKQDKGRKESDSKKPSDFTERRGKQGEAIRRRKGYSSIVDTLPPPDKKPKK